MHFLNRIAGPLGIVNGVTAGILNQLYPHRTGTPELLAATLAPLLFPVVACILMRLHRDLLKIEVELSPYNPNANPMSWFEPSWTNFLGLLAISTMGFSVGLLFVSFLNWPYNLAYSASTGLAALSLWLTVRALPALFACSDYVSQGQNNEMHGSDRQAASCGSKSTPVAP